MAADANGNTNGNLPVNDRDIYLVIRRAILAVVGIFDRKYNVRPTEK